MMIRKITVLALVAAFMFTSCSSDDDVTQTPLGDYERGLLITHEGNFGSGNASVSYISDDLATVEHGIFSSVNNTMLGDTAQSMAFNGDLAYIVVNVSNKVEVVNRYTFETVATIDTGLVNPRYMAFANGKGYITNWGDGSNPSDDYVAVLDLSTNTLETPIAVEEGPERLVFVNTRLYVAHQGGFSQNNVVSVISTNTNTVTETLTVGDVPRSIALDASGNIWVLAGGKPAWTGDETAGKLSKINTSNNTVTSIDFGATEHPNYLAVEGNTAYYYMNGDVYKMATSDTTLPTSSEFSGVSFYDMAVENGLLYGADAGDFVSDGSLKVYDLSTNTESESITVGAVPGGIYFN